MVFHWSLSDRKSPQVSRTLLCILAVLDSAVVSIGISRHMSILAKRNRFFFLDVYGLFTKYTQCEALCIVINFFCSFIWVFFPIFLPCQFLIILTKNHAQLFIPLIRILPVSLVSRSFLVLLKYSCLILSFIATFSMTSVSIFSKLL